jgi:hypothetical protein
LKEGKEKEKVVNTRSDWDLICIHVVGLRLSHCAKSTEKGDSNIWAGKQYFREYMGHKVTDTCHWCDQS